MTKSLKCYYCNKSLDEEDLVIKPIPLATKSGIRNYKRKFHIECLPKFLEENKDIEYKKHEDGDWDKVYQYFKKNVMELDDGSNVSQHAVERLLGLRVGQYKPNARNTRVIKKGYSFKTILYTLKYCQQAIDRSKATVNFVDENHMVNYIMKIVESNINFIQLQMDRVAKQNHSIKKIKEENKAPGPEITYKKKGSGKRKVVFT